MEPLGSFWWTVASSGVIFVRKLGWDADDRPAPRRNGLWNYAENFAAIPVLWDWTKKFKIFGNSERKLRLWRDQLPSTQSFSRAKEPKINAVMTVLFSLPMLLQPILTVPKSGQKFRKMTSTTLGMKGMPPGALVGCMNVIDTRRFWASPGVSKCALKSALFEQDLMSCPLAPAKSEPAADKSYKPQDMLLILCEDTSLLIAANQSTMFHPIFSW